MIFTQSLWPTTTDLLVTTSVVLYSHTVYAEHYLIQHALQPRSPGKEAPNTLWIPRSQRQPISMLMLFYIPDFCATHTIQNDIFGHLAKVACNKNEYFCCNGYARMSNSRLILAPVPARGAASSSFAPISFTSAFLLKWLQRSKFWNMFKIVWIILLKRIPKSRYETPAGILGHHHLILIKRFS